MGKTHSLWYSSLYPFVGIPRDRASTYDSPMQRRSIPNRNSPQCSEQLSYVLMWKIDGNPIVYSTSGCVRRWRINSFLLSGHLDIEYDEWPVSLELTDSPLSSPYDNGKSPHKQIRHAQAITNRTSLFFLLVILLLGSLLRCSLGLRFSNFRKDFGCFLIWLGLRLEVLWQFQSSYSRCTGGQQ